MRGNFGVRGCGWIVRNLRMIIDVPTREGSPADTTFKMLFLFLRDAGSSIV